MKDKQWPIQALIVTNEKNVNKHVETCTFFRLRLSAVACSRLKSPVYAPESEHTSTCACNRAQQQTANQKIQL